MRANSHRLVAAQSAIIACDVSVSYLLWCVSEHNASIKQKLWEQNRTRPRHKRGNCGSAYFGAWSAKAYTWGSGHETINKRPHAHASGIRAPKWFLRGARWSSMRLLASEGTLVLSAPFAALFDAWPRLYVFPIFVVLRQGVRHLSRAVLSQVAETDTFLSLYVERLLSMNVSFWYFNRI